MIPTSNPKVFLSIPLVPPSVNHYVKHTRSGRHYQTKEALAFKSAVGWAANKVAIPWFGQKRKPRYHVHVKIMLAAKQRLDVDNGLKVTLDALKDARVIHSDAAVMALSVSMGRDPERPRTEIEVERL